MELNFDNLRKGLIGDFNKMVEKCNKEQEKSSLLKHWDEPRLTVDDIRNELESMRKGLAVLACLEEEGEFEALDINLKVLGKKEDFEFVECSQCGEYKLLKDFEEGWTCDCGRTTVIKQ